MRPSPSIQNQVAEFISSIDGLIDNLDRKNLNLRRTRDLLLPKLISGAIDVESPDSVIATDIGELAA
jgi:type I restriction enzyme S subunit